MGVIDFSASLRHVAGAHHHSHDDILSFDVPDEENFEEEVNNGIPNQISRKNTSRTKRKHFKSSGSCYDFRDYGIDARRKGAKHQRRKQNFSDLLQMVDNEDLSNESLLFDDGMTAFAELFMDDTKMKIWEGFMNMSEDRQREYLEDLQEHDLTKSSKEDVEMIVEEEMKFLLVDKKIRDMLRSKKLAYDGLLRYYEDDVLSCMNEWFPSIIIFKLHDKYDRMLVYGLCQYMCLTWTTVKLNDSTIIEIELAHDYLKIPEVKLTEFLKRKVKE